MCTFCKTLELDDEHWALTDFAKSGEDRLSMGVSYDPNRKKWFMYTEFHREDPKPLLIVETEISNCPLCGLKLPPID